jgi:hypothetical protein
MTRPSLRTVALLLLVGSVAFSTARDQRQKANSPQARAERARLAVQEAQEGVDRCLEGLERSEARFRDQQSRTDAMAERIEALEGLHPQGVPVDSYAVYLELVEAFNASLAGWEAWGHALEEDQLRCAGEVRARNAQAELLRELLVEMGYLPESYGPQLLPE